MKKIVVLLGIGLIFPVLCDDGSLRDRLIDAGVGWSINPFVETSFDPFFGLPENGFRYLADLPSLMTSDAQVTEWIMIPDIGVLAPLRTGDFSHFEDWKKVSPVLEQGIGAYEVPNVGRRILLGHSSYYKSSESEFKTIFQAVPLLKPGQNIFIYTLRNYAWYERSYTVKTSLERNPHDTEWIVESTKQPVVSLITCVPIGTFSRRWVVEASEVNQRVLVNPIDIQRIISPPLIEKIVSQESPKNWFLWGSGVMLFLSFSYFSAVLVFRIFFRRK